MSFEKMPLRQRLQVHTRRRDYLMKIPVVKYVEEAASMAESNYAAWAFEIKIKPFMDESNDEEKITLMDAVCTAVTLCESRDSNEQEQGRRMLFELLAAPVYTRNKEA